MDTGSAAPKSTSTSTLKPTTKSTPKATSVPASVTSNTAKPVEASRVDPVQAGWHKPKNPAPGTIASAAPAAAGPSGAPRLHPKVPALLNKLPPLPNLRLLSPQCLRDQVTPLEVLPLLLKDQEEGGGRRLRMIPRRSEGGDWLSWTKWPKNRKRKNRDNNQSLSCWFKALLLTTRKCTCT